MKPAAKPIIKRARPLGLFVLIVAAIAGGVWLAWPRLFASPITTGPMVQMLAPDGFVLVWQMRPAESASVTVRHEGGESVGVFTADRTDDRCIAEIDGLQEGALYRYEITIAGKSGVPVLLAVGDVRTAPPPGDSFRVIAFGDSGTGKRAQYRLAERMPEYEPDLIIHTGDIVYFDGAAEDYPDHFFRPYASLLSRIPCYPCLGNHDVRTDDGAPALAAFVLPRNGPEAEPPERHYWFDFGDVRFVFIDSNRTFPIYQEVVAPWLDAVLADAGERRTILVFHEPFFTNARHKPAEKLQLSILPVIDRHRVNLALSGHNHLYERTHPIRDGQVVADGEGTVYITTGAGGGRLDEPPTPAPPFMAAANGSTYSFTVVDVQSAEFAVRQIATDGSVLDAATVVTPARVPASAADGLHPNVAERMTAKAPGTPRRIRTANRHE